MEVSLSSSPEIASPLDKGSRQPLLSRKKWLENGARVVTSTLGVGAGLGGASRVAGLLAGVPVAAGVWGVGLGQGVQSAEAFGGPSRPLNRYGCLSQGVFLAGVSVLARSGVAHAKSLVCVYGTFW